MDGGSTQMKGWTCTTSDVVHDGGRILRLRRDRLRSDRDPRTVLDYYVVECGPWMNVIPLTSDQEVVMVRQFRYGADEVTLEVPAGFVEPSETPLQSAVRELREETGCRAGSIEEIGRSLPNPALQNNTLHTFLARDVVRVSAQNLDPGEDIEVVHVPLADIPGRIRTGEIRHALVLAAFAHFLGLGSP